MRNGKKRSMHYDVNVIEVTEYGNSSTRDPERFMDVVVDRLAETQMLWEIVTPFAKEFI